MRFIKIVFFIVFLTACGKQLPLETQFKNILSDNLEGFNSLNKMLLVDQQFHDVCFKKKMEIQSIVEDPLFESGKKNKYVGILPVGTCYISKISHLIVRPLTLEKCYDNDCRVSFILMRSEINIPVCTKKSFGRPSSLCLIKGIGDWDILYQFIGNFEGLSKQAR